MNLYCAEYIGMVKSVSAINVEFFATVNESARGDMERNLSKSVRRGD